MSATQAPPFFLDLRRRVPGWLYRRNVLLDASLREWRRLRDRYKGQKGFVLGNGPSLTMEDLDRIAGKPALAANRMYLAYDQTRFRPTLLSCCDPIVVETMVDELRALPGKKFLSHHLAPIVEPLPGAVYWHETTGHTSDPKVLRKFSHNAEEGLFAGHTIIFNNLQIAFHLGLTTVYLLGMDFRFTMPKTTQQERYKVGIYDTLALVSDGEQNHFLPNYRKPGERWTVPQLDHQRTAFQSAKLHFEKRGRKIYNATRGGELEVFERKNLDEVLEQWDK